MSKPLNTLINQTKRRLKLRETLYWGMVALGLGLLITLLLLLLGRWYPLALPQQLLFSGLAATLFITVLTIGYNLLRPQPSLGTARLLDQQLNLNERLTTTLELTTTKHHIPTAIVEAQVTDTMQHIDDVNLAKTFPINLPWRWVGLVAILLAAITVSFRTPNPQVEILQGRAKAEQTIEKQQEELEELRAELLADELLLETPQGEELLQTLDELIETLEEENIALEEALAAASEATENLEQLQNLAEQQAETLNEVAQSFNQFESTSDIAEALEQRDLAEAAEQLATAGNQATENSELAEQLAESLRQAAEAAEQAGDSELAESLNEAAEALEQALAQEGGSPQEEGGEGESPQEGEGSAEANQQALQEAMEQAAEALAEAGDQLATQDSVEEALANIQEAQEQLADAAGQGQPQRFVEGEGTPENVGGSGRGDPEEGAEGLFSENAAPDAMNTDNGENEGRVEDYDSLYAPTHLGGEGGPLLNPEDQGAEGGIPVGEALVDPNQDPTSALVPYNQVYGEYADEAGQALEDSYIPLGMKGYIRNYFGALEPDSN
ncbi:MAG: hypothetical protein AAF485_08300 [Chloroflexota bacterium]